MTSGMHQSAFDIVQMIKQISLRHLMIADTGVENYPVLCKSKSYVKKNLRTT
jgi:hypothetical protein